MKSASKGLSLIEMAVVMVFVSLALVPVVQMIGKPSDATGNMARTTAHTSQSAVLANAIVERALSGDYSVIACGGSFNTATDFNKPTAVCNNTQVGMNYKQDLYYQFTLQDSDPSGTAMPSGEKMYQAMLNVYDTYPSSSTIPVLSIPVFLHNDAYTPTTQKDVTGLSIVQDVSGSMCDGGNGLNCYQNSGVGLASPFLVYPYADPTHGYNPPAGVYARNFTDDKQLDIASAKVDDDPTTPWDDRFPRTTCSPPSANCYGNATGVAATSGAFYPPTLSYGALVPNYNIYNYPPMSSRITSPIFSTNAKAPTTSTTQLGATESQYVSKLSQSINGTATTSTSNPLYWGGPYGVINNNFSKIEAARTALLTLVWEMESNAKVRNNLRMGFTTFDNATHPQYPQGSNVNMESIDTTTGHFDKMRYYMSWINRAGPGNIFTAGSTGTYDAVARGAQVLCQDPNINKRILLFASDGQPTAGDQNPSDIAKLALALNTGNPGIAGNHISTPGVSISACAGKPITIYTINLLDIQNKQSVQTMDYDLTQCSSFQPSQTDVNTNNPPIETTAKVTGCDPGNSYKGVADVGTMDAIFDQLAYQIQTLTLENAAGRYPGLNNY